MIRQIWIASHFHNIKRIELFKETLKSIENQIKKPDLILLSFSIQEDIINSKDLIYDLFKMVSISYKILFQNQRLYQFEHLERIYEYVIHNYEKKEIYISFCDDDDLLSEDYIIITNKYLNYDKINCFFHCINEDTTYETKNNRRVISNYSEYGGMSCLLAYFENFIHSVFYKSDTQTADIYLSVYSDPKFKQIIIQEPLYYYRKYNNIYNMKLWHFSKELTNSDEYKQLLELVKNNINKDYIIYEWLYTKKENKYIESLDKFITNNLN